MSFSAGTLLGPYEILSALGAGFDAMVEGIAQQMLERSEPPTAFVAGSMMTALAISVSQSAA